MFRLTHQHRRGNSLVEMVLLVPLYALIISGAMLLGELGLVIMRSHGANEYAAWEPGDQSEAAGETEAGVLKSRFWTPYEGSLELRENGAGDVPTVAEVEELFEEMMKVQYSTSAHGSYTFENGRLVYRIDTRQNAWRHGDAKVVESYDLLDDNIAELTHETMRGYMARRRVDTRYNFAPKYLTWSRFELEGAMVPTRYQTAVRSTLSREVDQQFGAPNAPIENLTPRFGDGPGAMPDYPQFEDTRTFWEPN